MEGQQSLAEEAAKLRHDARETSRLAALKAAPNSGTSRRSLLEVLVRVGGEKGLTDDELSETLGISPNTIRPRRLELLEGEWITDSDREAQSFYGNKATAWRATSKGVLLIEDTYRGEEQ